MNKKEVAIYWMRRDLRLDDNTALNKALQNEICVLPVFIFDDNILEDLNREDARLSFIYKTLFELNKKLKVLDSGIKVYQGRPIEVWKKILLEYKVTCVYANKDYEPYARSRDKELTELLLSFGVDFKLYKDQVIFEENEILKKDGKPISIQSITREISERKEGHDNQLYRQWRRNELERWRKLGWRCTNRYRRRHN